MRALRARGTLVVGLSRRPSEADEHEECDVSDRAAVEAVAARVLERHPQIDLLVNNAGVGARGNYLTVEPDAIERVIRVNYLGSVWSTLAFLPGLGQGSHVVNVVSVAGMVAGGPYSASKHAQLAFSRSITVELAPRGISVHTVNPGFVETEGFRSAAVWGCSRSWSSIRRSSCCGCSRRSTRTSPRSSCRAGTACSPGRRRSRRGS